MDLWCSNLRLWEGPACTFGYKVVLYMYVYVAFMSVSMDMYGNGKVTVTERPTWLPYSSCSYLCRKPTEMGQVPLEWRNTALTLR